MVIAFMVIGLMISSKVKGKKLRMMELNTRGHFNREFCMVMEKQNGSQALVMKGNLKKALLT